MNSDTPKALFEAILWTKTEINPKATRGGPNGPTFKFEEKKYTQC